MLYFGYGSNLCERDWGEWCSRHGEEASGLRFARRAWLPEHELAFTFNSGGRGGGVLDVVERFGQAAPGALFEVDEASVLERAIAKRLDGPIRDRAQFRRLYQALLRQGFPPDRVAAALVVRSERNVVMSGFPDGGP